MGFALLLGCGSDGGGRGETNGTLGNSSLSGTSSDTNNETSDAGQDTQTTTAGDGDGDGDGGDPIKYDFIIPDAPTCDGGGGGGDASFSYIWIANSSQGSVSKINTLTMVEEGRYYVRPDLVGSPSRTSVSLSGDVAVANRLGGVAKIYANIDNCQESNGVPGIQTSTGGQDLLPWGSDECIAWYTPLNYASNRPAAWAPGIWNSQSCAYENEKLWTSGSNGPGSTQVLLLDGETGVVEQTVNIPEIQNGIGLYGGAVDGDGNFWGLETSPVRLYRVDRNNFSVQSWPVPAPAYGITVDEQGRPWTCAGGGASRFDPILQTWQTYASPGGNQWGGCMTDGNGKLWHCRQLDAMLVSIDTETLTLVDQIQLPAYAHGISIDFFGYVWAVGFVSSEAYRVDPVFKTIDTFNQLVGAYTYSDMTGFALSSAGTPGG